MTFEIGCAPPPPRAAPCSGNAAHQTARAFPPLNDFSGYRFQKSGLGYCDTPRSTGIADEWRSERLVVLAVIAPRAAKFLLPEDLRQLSDAAKATAVQMTDPEVKSALSQIATVLMQR
jgi:hypothetical protein